MRPYRRWLSLPGHGWWPRLHVIALLLLLLIGASPAFDEFYNLLSTG